ncbi:heparinase II/III family protein [Cohnella sp. GbtcB17]|uniref:heparinase II/III domain-containing protein n=1 Tax=Cohnella sp. GbtcB17 TaxID=2824762 RepID=UPI001C30A9D4|nr:heparinase II/III family protein [Cohnella sp. GbtcB17]
MEKSHNREKLEKLVERAQEMLRTRSAYFTEGSKLAIGDLVGEAERALEGKVERAFTRSRAFYRPREEEEMMFASHRYTMAPTYRKEGVFDYYGLEPGLAWFEQQDMGRLAEEELRARAVLAIQKANELLDGATFGQDVGCYDASAGSTLKSALEDLEVALREKEAADWKDRASRAVVVCFDRIRDFRFSRVFRTDLDPKSSLYFAREQLEGIKQSVRTRPLVRAQYEQIVGLSERFSPAYIDKAMAQLTKETFDYDELNADFYLWSTTDKIVNFTAPARAVTASIAFILPAEENERDGLGHVWIDDLHVLSATGGSLDIANGGFDEGGEAPDCWNAVPLQGNPVLRWEDRYPFCGGGDRAHGGTANPSSQVAFRYAEDAGRRSLYICNPTSQDEGSWQYEGRFAVRPEEGYTLTFAAKIDGKLKRGLRTVITYYDSDEQIAGIYEYDFNRKSSLPAGWFQLSMQCDAIRHAMTGERTYAQKAKQEMLYTLHDFCQGAEHWLATNLRPEGSDSYGAVQGGRLLCSAAVSYSLIKEAGVFDQAEKEKLYAMVDYLLRYMIDLRDRTELTPQEAQHASSNWQTDMCAGTVFMMLALDDFPNRKPWLYNALAVLKAQLELNVNPDRSWPESIRYHHAALERFAGIAKVLLNGTGDDWFRTTPLARMFGFSIEMQTPGYAYFGDRIGTPPFGDHALGDGGEFGSFAAYFSDVANVDRQLADRMFRTWEKAGKPFKKLWGEGVVLENIMSACDDYESAASLNLTSTRAFPNAGIYVFRNRYGTPEESYFAIMSSPEPIAHGHLDQGSFVLYKKKVPLVMDSGIEGYFDSSTRWHISAYSHACVQFATGRTDIVKDGEGAINLSAGTYSLERGWVDVPRTSKVVDCELDPDTDSITIEIRNPEGNGRHLRHVVYWKEPDLYLIEDTVMDFEGDLLFSLPVASKGSVVRGQRVYSPGTYGIDLETVFVSRVKRIGLEKGRSTPFFDSGNSDYSTMDYIRAVANANDGFVTLLYPKEHGQAAVEVEETVDGALRIAAGNWQTVWKRR